MKKHLLLSLIFVLIASKSMSAQIMLKEVSLSKQIEKSTLVLEGKVLSKKSFWDANHKKIYTVNTIEVLKVFKGDLPATVDIITLGGVMDTEAQLVSPNLELQIGDLGVFTLYDSNVTLDPQAVSAKKRFLPYGSSQGFYKYNIHTDEVSNIFSTKKGITDSFYKEIKSITKADYLEVSHFDVKSKIAASSKASNALAIVISGFTPTTSTAGTKSVLTINGSGFGSVKGKVGFSNADFAGVGYVDALDTQVLTWSNTQITVEIPSKAGTGKIRITHNDTSSLASNSNLTITYSQINVVFDSSGMGDRAYPAQHADNNGNGGNTWRMTTAFSAIAGAKEVFSRALETWRCETKINWVFNDTNLVTTSQAQHQYNPDDINTITFDSSTSGNPADDLPDTVLGSRSIRFVRCPLTTSVDLKWYIREFDIVFDDESDWNFSINPPTGKLDFESVVLHELGHCHLLDHVVDTNDVMHYSILNGQSRRVLGSQNITIANIIQARSTGTQVCSQPLMTDNNTCSLGIEENALNTHITLYPNPTNDILFIKNDGLVVLEKALVYDLSGRLMFKQDISSPSRLKTIHLNSFSKGIYFVNIHSDKTFITKKVVLE